MASATNITVYTRANCHLCEDAIKVIHRVNETTDVSIEVELVNVDEDPELQEEYGDRVPYVLVDDRPVFKYSVDEAELRARVTGE
jgi:glutaredoxin